MKTFCAISKSEGCHQAAHTNIFILFVVTDSESLLLLAKRLLEDEDESVLLLVAESAAAEAEARGFG